MADAENNTRAAMPTRILRSSDPDVLRGIRAVREAGLCAQTVLVLDDHWHPDQTPHAMLESLAHLHGIRIHYGRATRKSSG